MINKWVTCSRSSYVTYLQLLKDQNSDSDHWMLAWTTADLFPKTPLCSPSSWQRRLRSPQRPYPTTTTTTEAPKSRAGGPEQRSPSRLRPSVAPSPRLTQSIQPMIMQAKSLQRNLSSSQSQRPMLSQPRAISRPAWLPQRGSAATQCWLQSHPLIISRTGDCGMKYQIYHWSFFVSYRTDSSTVDSPSKFTPFWCTGLNWIKYICKGGLI